MTYNPEEQNEIEKVLMSQAFAARAIRDSFDTDKSMALCIKFVMAKFQLVLTNVPETTEQIEMAENVRTTIEYIYSILGAERLKFSM